MDEIRSEIRRTESGNKCRLHSPPVVRDNHNNNSSSRPTKSMTVCGCVYGVKVARNDEIIKSEEPAGSPHVNKRTVAFS